VFSVTLINHFVLALCVVALAETIGLWFLCNKLVIPENRRVIALWIYQLSVLASFVSILQIPFSASIIAHERMKVYAYGGMLEVMLRLGIVSIMAIVPFDKLGFWAASTCGLSIVMMFIYYLYARTMFPYCRFQVQTEIALYRAMLSYSGWDLFGSLSGIAQGQGLNMLLNVFFGPSVNASRGISYQVQGAITQFGHNFMMAVRPQIVKYYAMNEKEKMMNLVYRSARYSFYLFWILSIPVLIETEYLLTLWLKVVPEYTVVFTRIVLVISVIGAWRTPFVTAIHATGRIKLLNIICGSLLIATLPVSYVGLRLGYAPPFVFVVSLVLTLINMWAEWYLVKRAVCFPLRSAVCKVLLVSLGVAVVSFIVSFGVHYIQPIGFIRLLSVSVTALLIMPFIVYLIGMEHEERMYINRKVKLLLNQP
jgi:O-antigen/teichoic acid export membrane protein